MIKYYYSWRDKHLLNMNLHGSQLNNFHMFSIILKKSELQLKASYDHAYSFVMADL